MQITFPDIHWDNKNGFRFTLSTADVLKAITEYVYLALDNNGEARTMALDILKVFSRDLSRWSSTQATGLRYNRTNVPFNSNVQIKS